MPNIISQRLTDKEIYIKATNGKEFILTRDQLAEHSLLESGSANIVKTKTIDWLKSEIQKALGSEMIDTADISFDMDGIQSPNKLEIGSK